MANVIFFTSWLSLKEKNPWFMVFLFCLVFFTGDVHGGDGHHHQYTRMGNGRAPPQPSGAAETSGGATSHHPPERQPRRNPFPKPPISRCRRQRNPPPPPPAAVPLPKNGNEALQNSRLPDSGWNASLGQLLGHRPWPQKLERTSGFLTGEILGSYRWQGFQRSTLWLHSVWLRPPHVPGGAAGVEGSSNGSGVVGTVVWLGSAGGSLGGGDGHVGANGDYPSKENSFEGHSDSTQTRLFGLVKNDGFLFRIL